MSQTKNNTQSVTTRHTKTAVYAPNEKKNKTVFIKKKKMRNLGRNYVF
jgi:hypothetical protein